MYTPLQAFSRGVRAELPILLGAVPFGLVYGVLARGAGLSAAAAQAMSVIVFAGSAQFVTAQLIGAGTPALVIVVTAFFVNLRHMLYSASVAPYLERLPRRWRWTLAYLLTDEAYAVAIIHYQQEPEAAHQHWFFLGAGLALWSGWQASTAVGVLLGAQVPPSWSLDFTLSLTFIALIVPTLASWPAGATAVTAGLLAVLAHGLPYKLGLIVATVGGMVVGLALEQRQRVVASKTA